MEKLDGKRLVSRIIKCEALRSVEGTTSTLQADKQAQTFIYSDMSDIYLPFTRTSNPLVKVCLKRTPDFWPELAGFEYK